MEELIGIYIHRLQYWVQENVQKKGYNGARGSVFG
jgi:hypothetical protein